MFPERRLLFSTLIFVAGITSPASAGFWEDLFGRPSVSAHAAVAPGVPMRRLKAAADRKRPRESRKFTVYRWAPKRVAHGAAHSRHRHPVEAGTEALAVVNHAQAAASSAHPPAVKRFGNVDEAASAAKTDATLRRGDIVSTLEGLRVFVGDRKADRNENFVKVTHKQVESRLRKILSAYAPEPPRPKPPALQAAPAATENAGAPLNALRAIETYVSDAQGRRIRFVGGQAPEGVGMAAAPRMLRTSTPALGDRADSR
jgi:hypothetical protein